MNMRVFMLVCPHASMCGWTKINMFGCLCVCVHEGVVVRIYM